MYICICIYVYIDLSLKVFINEKGKPSKAVDETVIKMFADLYGEAKLVDGDEIVDRLMIAMPWKWFTVWKKVLWPHRQKRIWR